MDLSVRTRVAGLAQGGSGGPEGFVRSDAGWSNRSMSNSANSVWVNLVSLQCPWSNVTRLLMTSNGGVGSKRKSCGFLPLHPQLCLKFNIAGSVHCVWRISIGGEVQKLNMTDYTPTAHSIGHFRRPKSLVRISSSTYVLLKFQTRSLHGPRNAASPEDPPSSTLRKVDANRLIPRLVNFVPEVSRIAR